MKPTALRWIAGVSALISLATGEAARRPHYGGELRVEMRADASDLIAGAVFETLVRLDDHGDPQPWLATSWTHDAARKRWIFTPRANVTMHNGAIWTPAAIEISDEKPIEQILRELARNAVIVRADDGSMIGTGPFHVAHSEPGKRLTLAAHDGYWGGRPYLDTIQITMGRSLRDQAVDLEVGKADVVEIAPTQRQRTNAYVSQPRELFALQFDDRVPPATREAVALSIDRTAIYNVLLQKTGEISGALLPRWLSGYAFLFSMERNVARAKQLAPGAALSFAYDRQDSLIRAIGERISVNTSEAGITLRQAAGTPDVRLIETPILSRNAWTSLEDLSTIFKMPLSGMNLYEAERALLADFRIVPLFHLPDAWAMNGHVRNWPGLADVWLDPRGKQ
jgi:peptide/nickel transport system substrate-binding protein